MNDVQGLFCVTQNYLAQNLTNNNVMDRLLLADIYNAQYLLDMALHHVISNPHVLTKNVNVSCLPPDLQKRIVDTRKEYHENIDKMAWKNKGPKAVLKKCIDEKIKLSKEVEFVVDIVFWGVLLLFIICAFVGFATLFLGGANNSRCSPPPTAINSVANVTGANVTDAVQWVSTVHSDAPPFIVDNLHSEPLVPTLINITTTVENSEANSTCDGEEGTTAAAAATTSFDPTRQRVEVFIRCAIRLTYSGHVAHVGSIRPIRKGEELTILYDLHRINML
eukprot:gene37107-45778_t